MRILMTRKGKGKDTCKVSLLLERECGATCWLSLYLQLMLNSVLGWTQRNTYLGRGLKGGVHSNFWHVPVVDVLVAIPNAVDQVSLASKLELFTTYSALILW